MRCALVLHLNGQSQESLQFALDAMLGFNELWLRRHGGPRLYDAGVVYATEPAHGRSVAGNEERIASIPEVLSLGWGDCDDLACYLAAERRVYDGIGARPKVVLEGIGPDGSHHWHVVVVHPDGSLEDPSVMLGMGKVGGGSLQGLYPEELE